MMLTIFMHGWVQGVAVVDASTSGFGRDGMHVGVIIVMYAALATSI